MFKKFLPLLFVTTSGFAFTETDGGGKLWMNHLRKASHIPSKYTEQNAGLFVTGKTKPTDKTTAKAELLGYYIKSPYLEAPGKDLKKGELFFEINELSLNFQSESWILKAGQMTTSWGKSDGLNPTDFLSGRRNVLLVPEDQLTRRGHGSAMVEWLPNEGSSPWSVQQWIVPFHSTTDVLLISELTQDLVELQSNSRSKRVEIATKINYSGQGWEFDYTYFNGVNKNPVFTETFRSLSPFHLKLKPRYVHQEGHGINLAKDFEQYIVRLEAAYVKRNEVLTNADYIKDPTRLDAVIGIEKSFFETHRLNIQGVVNHYPSYHRASSQDVISAQVQYLNRYVLAQHQQTRAGTLLVYNFEPEEHNQIKIKCSWLNYFYNEGASFFTPQLEYLVNDHFQLQTYALLFDGSKNSPFGILKELSSVALGASYQF
jgi:hypothetical protein